MPMPRKYESNAARQAAYRERLRAKEKAKVALVERVLKADAAAVAREQ